MSLDFFSAFIIGLLGSGHCVVMCGGISTMLTTAISDASQQKKYVIIFAYNFGRIASYSVIGALVAFTSSMATKEIGLPVSLLKTIAGIFLILLGLYLGQWLMWLSHVEHLGKNLWRHISPKTKKFIPIKNINSAFALGALWGWLPCGLVYSTLTWALASADAINGALIMAFTLYLLHIYNTSNMILVIKKPKKAIGYYESKIMHRSATYSLSKLQYQRTMLAIFS